MNDIKRDMFFAFMTGYGAPEEWVTEAWEDGLTLDEAMDAWDWGTKEMPKFREWYESYAENSPLSS